jgi:hypothetical protein
MYVHSTQPCTDIHKMHMLGVEGMSCTSQIRSMPGARMYRYGNSVPFRGAWVLRTDTKPEQWSKHYNLSMYVLRMKKH